MTGVQTCALPIYNNTSGNNRTYKKYGTISNDLTIYNTIGPSERLTPNNAATNLESGLLRVAVPYGRTCTFACYVRKSSAVIDGTAYNGTQPILLLKANPAAGIDVDTTLYTGSLTTGLWEKYTGTTPAVSDDAILSFAIQCNGTTGWVNLDLNDITAVIN